MRTCVISPGVVHAVPRTVAMAPHLDEVHFIDVPGTADRATLTRAGIRCHALPDERRSSVASVDLQRLLRELRPDVIACHYGSGDHFFNAVAYGRCPVAVIAMGNDVLYADGDTPTPPLRALLIREGFRRAGYVAAKSTFIEAATRALGFAGPMDLNYWGCDLARFAPGDAANARRELGLPPEGPLVLSPRAIEPRLNIHRVVEGFAAVAARHPAARLVILGRSMRDYRERVLGDIARFGLAGRVSVLDEVGQDVLPTWYRAADVVVSVGAVEGFPNTVLEVMATGVPVLVGDIPQVRELLADGVNARLCALEAPAIARGLLDLLGDPAGAARLARAGQATARDRGDIAVNGRRFAEALRATAARPAPGTLSLLPYRALLGGALLMRRFLPDVC